MWEIKETKNHRPPAIAVIECFDCIRNVLNAEWILLRHTYSRFVVSFIYFCALCTQSESLLEKFIALVIICIVLCDLNELWPNKKPQTDHIFHFDWCISVCEHCAYAIPSAFLHIKLHKFRNNKLHTHLAYLAHTWWTSNGLRIYNNLLNSDWIVWHFVDSGLHSSSICVDSGRPSNHSIEIKLQTKSPIEPNIFAGKFELKLQIECLF